MSEAIAWIVGAYVKLRNRKVLEDMKVHRQGLITELKSVHGAFDSSLLIKQLDDEMTVIEAGLTMQAQTEAHPNGQLTASNARSKPRHEAWRPRAAIRRDEE
jgi:hypothetical protein